jgi:hypothetical protein
MMTNIFVSLAVIDVCNPNPCDPLSECFVDAPGMFSCGPCPSGYDTEYLENGATKCNGLFSFAFLF